MTIKENKSLYAVEYSIEFLSGWLKGIKRVQRIETSFPEWYRPGKIYQDLTGNIVQIIEVVVE